MAQQTINIGASPNDGTGTPLRTAFQYTNSNFSELYTAVGPSGNNIVVPGSATITGNLTVNGSYISCGNNSYIRTDATNLFSIQTGSLGFRIMNAGNSALFYGIDSASTSTWYDGAGGTRMTLNATGLGVGAVPSGNNQLTIRSSGAGTEMTVSLGRASAEGIIGIAAGTNGFVNGSVAGDMVVRSIGKLMLFNNGANAGITIDTAANVGIGVTPTVISGGSGNTKGLQGDSWTISSFLGTDQAYFASNLYTSAYGVWSNRVNAGSGAYLIAGAEHRWLSGAAKAPGTITPTQAMTLDASGNLLVGSGISGARLSVRDAAGNDSYIGLGANNDIYLSTGASGVHYFRKAANAAAMTLDASGRLLVGPTSANASGGVLQLSSGITFPATQVASSDANTLDDYEEGTFTPTITASAGTLTTTTVNEAVYTKIGRLVSVAVDISIVNVGTASGQLFFSLPFNQTVQSNVGALRELGATGQMGQIIYQSGTQVSASLYNNGTLIVNGYRIRGTYTYTV